MGIRTIPPFAAGASTTRIPTDLLGPLRQTAATLRGYLTRTLTAPPDRYDSAPSRHRRHPHPYCQSPQQDATP